MNKGIIHNFRKVAELENPAWAKRQNTSDEQPTVADLALPETGYKFSDGYACLLRELESDFA